MPPRKTPRNRHRALLDRLLRRRKQLEDKLRKEPLRPLSRPEVKQRTSALKEHDRVTARIRRFLRAAAARAARRR